VDDSNHTYPLLLFASLRFLCASAVNSTHQPPTTIPQSAIGGPILRVAAIYDIHGNLPALEAVLNEIRQEGVDSIVVGGDMVPGAMCREVMERLLGFGMPVQFIRGNCEREMLSVVSDSGASGVPERYQGPLRWVAQELGTENQRLMARWPLTLTVDIEGLGRVLFCHATPRDDNEIFTRLTDEERLLPVFEGVEASVVVCGHTHMQFDRMVARVRVVNAGSVGMPFGEPGAYWLLLGPNVQLRRTLYDLASAAERIRSTAYPQAEDFAAKYVLNTPAEEEMLQAFSAAELK
jgi:putative phosphoesterase